MANLFLIACKILVIIKAFSHTKRAGAILDANDQTEHQDVLLVVKYN